MNDVLVNAKALADESLMLARARISEMDRESPEKGSFNRMDLITGQHDGRFRARKSRDLNLS